MDELPGVVQQQVCADLRVNSLLNIWIVKQNIKYLSQLLFLH